MKAVCEKRRIGEAGKWKRGRDHVEVGQASIEAVAGVAVLLLAGLACLQLLAVGYAASAADGAAEAGAVALVRGRPVTSAVRSALPGWADSRVSVFRTGDTVRVRLSPLALLTDLGDGLAVTSSATASSR